MTSSQIVWLPPIYPGHALQFGVEPSGIWYYQQTSGDILPFENTTLHPGLLPLLQDGYSGSFSHVLEVLSSHLEQAHLNGDLSNTFPIEAIIRTAFQGNTFWIGLALERITEVADIPLKWHSLLEEVYERGLEQKQSHQVLELIRSRKHLDRASLQFPNI